MFQHSANSNGKCMYYICHMLNPYINCTMHSIRISALWLSMHTTSAIHPDWTCMNTNHYHAWCSWLIISCMLIACIYFRYSTLGSATFGCFEPSDLLVRVISWWARSMFQLLLIRWHAWHAPISALNNHGLLICVSLCKTFVRTLVSPTKAAYAAAQPIVYCICIEKF